MTIPAWAQLPYEPRDPESYNPPIGMIGCGGITKEHCLGYVHAGYNVVALCDIDLAAAQARRDEFYPNAKVYADHNELLRQHDEIEVVDITTHPAVRPPIIEAALLAKKHVLSQKPFVLDLDVGERLVELADKQGCTLAVNQNARWAPYFSYIREAIHRGLLGDVFAVHLDVHWDHTWTAGTEFEKIEHLIMYDYAIHWFDIIRAFMPDEKPTRVYASRARSRHQPIKPPMLAQALVEFEHCQASLAFDACTPKPSLERAFVSGTTGTAFCAGKDNAVSEVTLRTEQGSVTTEVEGTWFPVGFHGTMGELLRSIEEKRQPEINAADNLISLALCFAGVASSVSGQPVVPGSVRKLPS
jgi:predicted dehydrogenase